jgi:hypothetical protein
MAYQEIRLVDADELVVEGNKRPDTLEGLTFVIHAGDDTGMAGLYAGQLEARVRSLEALLRSADPNLREVRARLRN